MSTTEEPSPAPLQILIPKEALLEAAKIASKVASPDNKSTIGNVCIEIEGSSIAFVATDGYRMYRQTLPAMKTNPYPNYRSLIPKEFEGSFTVDRDALLGALKAVPGDPRGAFRIKLSIDAELVVSGIAGDGGNTPISVVLPLQAVKRLKDEKNNSVCLNNKFLAHALKSVPPGPTTIRYNGPLQLIGIHQGMPEDNMPYVAIVMPIRG